MNKLPKPLDKFRLEKRAGEHKDFGVTANNPYPLKGVTYPVDYGDLPGYVGEDGANLDIFVGQTGTLRGYIKVYRPELVGGEHKFYINVTDHEEEAILKEFQPVLLGYGRFESLEDLLSKVETFRAPGEA